MRVGILTFSRALNLGAVLQAYSLQKKLEYMKIDAEIIDYQCPAIDEMHKIRPVFKWRIPFKLRIYNLIYNIVFSPRRIKYKKFQKSMKKSDAYTRESIFETNAIYDVFITGSDQVFNLKLTNYDETYFLDFVRTGKKVAYAASVGVYVVAQREIYRKHIKTFDCLSLREKTFADLFFKDLNVLPEVIPDPVFLHTGEEWKSLLRVKEKKNKKKYLLIYSLIENEELYQYANIIARRKGIEIVAITKELRPKGKADLYVRNAGPREFINFIVNSEYVVTNSFHGVAFSLIFEKQFEVVAPTVAKERIEDLLDGLNLANRIYSGKLIDDVEINYSIFKNEINQLKKDGMAYLNKIFL